MFEARWNDSTERRTFAETPVEAADYLRAIAHGPGETYIYKYHSHELVKVITYRE